MNPDLEKTDWVNEPLRLPRDWLDIANQIGRGSHQSRADIIRRALRLGLPLVAEQERMGEKWVGEMLAQPPLRPPRGRPVELAVHERPDNGQLSFA